MSTWKLHSGGRENKKEAKKKVKKRKERYEEKTEFYAAPAKKKISCIYGLLQVFWVFHAGIGQI